MLYPYFMMPSYKSDKCMRKDEMSTDPKHVQIILWLASNKQTPKISMKIWGYHHPNSPSPQEKRRPLLGDC